MVGSSKPKVSDASAIASEVLKAVETVKMIEDYSAHRFGLGGEAEIDGDAPSARLIPLESAPMGYAGAA